MPNKCPICKEEHYKEQMDSHILYAHSHMELLKAYHDLESHRTTLYLYNTVILAIWAIFILILLTVIGFVR